MALQSKWRAVSRAKPAKKSAKPRPKSKKISKPRINTAPVKAKVRRFSKKVVFIVVDGMADSPKEGRTPLSEAKTPNMDWMTSNGACGQLDLVPRGGEVASQIANISLLGYDPSRYDIRRGPLEVVGAGLPLANGHLALRCNFCTVDNDMKVVDRRAGRTIFGLDDIAQYINQQVDVGARHFFMRTFGHRGILVLQDNLSDEITGNDAPVGQAVKRIMPSSTAAGTDRSARLVQDFIDKARNVMQYHQKNQERISKGLLPANYLICRGAGNKLFTLPNFSNRWGIRKAVCVAENGVMKATCMAAGFSSINVPEIEGKDYRLDQTAMLDFAFDSIEAALAEYDFVYVHLKGPDEAAHDKDPERKRKLIEEIDAKLADFKKFDGLVVLTCDHITSSITGSHERGPVPVVVVGRRKDSVKKFSEEAVKSGSLKVMGGYDLMKYIFGK
jgi:2,3-bisphosphoglycerate-independent phosphoglycerate mutase